MCGVGWGIHWVKSNALWIVSCICQGKGTVDESLCIANIRSEFNLGSNNQNHYGDAVEEIETGYGCLSALDQQANNMLSAAAESRDACGSGSKPDLFTDVQLFGSLYSQSVCQQLIFMARICLQRLLLISRHKLQTNTNMSHGSTCDFLAFSSSIFKCVHHIEFLFLHVFFFQKKHHCCLFTSPSNIYNLEPIITANVNQWVLPQT